METRKAFDYLKPTTLVQIIDEVIGALEDAVYDEPPVRTLSDVRTIRDDAFNALLANVGHDDALAMLFAVGIGPEELNW